MRSRAGLRAVAKSLGVLGLTAALQAIVFVVSGSVALLADLVHNAGDALTALPVGAAFFLRSARAEKIAGYFVVLAIFVSACFALVEAIRRLIDPEPISSLGLLAIAGAIGSSATRSRPASGYGRENGSAARHSSPTASTRAWTPSSRWASWRAPSWSRSGRTQPTHSSGSGSPS